MLLNNDVTMMINDVTMMVTCPTFYQQLCAQMKYIEQSSEDIITFNI